MLSVKHNPIRPFLLTLAIHDHTRISKTTTASLKLFLLQRSCVQLNSEPFKNQSEKKCSLAFIVFVRHPDCQITLLLMPGTALLHSSANDKMLLSEDAPSEPDKLLPSLYADCIFILSLWWQFIQTLIFSSLQDSSTGSSAAWFSQRFNIVTNTTLSSLPTVLNKDHLIKSGSAKRLLLFYWSWIQGKREVRRSSSFNYYVTSVLYSPEHISSEEV